MARTKFNPIQLLYGIVRHRQGSTSGDGNWGTAGSNNTDVSGKNVFIQVGSTSSNSGSDVSVTFPVAFTYIPLVVGTANTVANANVSVQTFSVTTTGFSLRAVNDAGSRAAETISWIAIGQ